MISILFGIILIAVILWAAKNFYFPTDMAQNPGRYPPSVKKLSKRELSTVLSHVQRWRNEGKITREEYDHLTDLCLTEIKYLEDQEEGK